MARRADLRKVPRKRYKHDASLTPLPPNVNITSATHAATSPNVTFVFDNPVLYIGTVPPKTMLIGGKTAVSYASKTSTGCVIVFSGNVAAAETLTISPNDPAIRTQPGGWLSATKLATV